MASKKSEGKTLGAPSIKCDSCKEDGSSQFCIDCNQPLCVNCLKYHGRLAATRHHRTIPIDQHSVVASSTTISPPRAFCAKHQKDIIKLCEDCLQVLCQICEADHKGHNIKQSVHDANLLHRVSAQKVPGLLELLQQLKDYEDGTPRKIKLYQEAEKLVKSWKDELLDVITKDAEQILKEIRSEILKQETLMAETAQSAKEYIMNVDKEISKLNEARRIHDTNTLMTRLTNCDAEMNKTKHLLTQMRSTTSTKTVADILPFKDEFDNTKKLLKQLWSWEAIIDGASNDEDSTAGGRESNKERIFSNLVKTRETQIPTESTYTDVNLCEDFMSDPKQVLTYELCESTARVFSLGIGRMSLKKWNKKFWKIVSVPSNRYIAIEVHTWKVFLLDSNLNHIKTILGSSNNFEPRGLCLKSQNTVVVTQLNSSAKVVRFTEIKIEGNKVHCQPVIDVNGFDKNFDGITVFHGEHVSMTRDEKTLCTIHLQTGEVTTMHFSEIIRSICADGDSILIGTQTGTVYRVKDGQNIGPILSGLRRIFGILSTENVIILTSGDYNDGYKLLMYDRVA